MSFLRQIWRDIRRGENLDLYVTILLAVILTTLNILGIASNSYIPPLTLAILALLSISILGNRYRLDTIIASKTRNITDILQGDFPDNTQQEIEYQMRSCRDLLIIGTDLDGTLQKHYHLLEQRLKDKKTIRIVLVDPNGSSCDMLAKRRYRPVTGDQYRTKVRSSLDALDQIKIKTGGEILIRLLDFPIARGGIFIDTRTQEGALYIWNHTFKTPREAQPKLALRASDGYWFSLFVEEAEAMWNNSVEHR